AERLAGGAGGSVDEGFLQGAWDVAGGGVDVPGAGGGEPFEGGGVRAEDEPVDPAEVVAEVADEGERLRELEPGVEGDEWGVGPEGADEVCDDDGVLAAGERDVAGWAVVCGPPSQSVEGLVDASLERVGAGPQVRCVVHRPRMKLGTAVAPPTLPGVDPVGPLPSLPLAMVTSFRWWDQCGRVG